MKRVRNWLGFGLAVLLAACAATPTEPVVATRVDVSSPRAAESLDIAIGAKGKYLWNDRQWEINDLKSALKRERRARPFNEIRLVDNGVSMTIGHMIEVGALGKEVGVRAFYEKGDEFKEIIFVE